MPPSPPNSLTAPRASLPLTLAEASQMSEVEFRFAEFNPEQNRYRISRPYELVIVPEGNSLTKRQT